MKLIYLFFRRNTATDNEEHSGGAKAGSTAEARQSFCTERDTP